MVVVGPYCATTTAALQAIVRRLVVSDAVCLVTRRYATGMPGAQRYRRVPGVPGTRHYHQIDDLCNVLRTHTEWSGLRRAWVAACLGLRSEQAVLAVVLERSSLRQRDRRQLLIGLKAAADSIIQVWSTDVCTHVPAGPFWGLLVALKDATQTSLLRAAMGMTSESLCAALLALGPTEALVFDGYTSPPRLFTISLSEM